MGYLWQAQGSDDHLSWLEAFVDAFYHELRSGEELGHWYTGVSQGPVAKQQLSSCLVATVINIHFGAAKKNNSKAHQVSK